MKNTKESSEFMKVHRDANGFYAHFRGALYTGRTPDEVIQNVFYENTTERKPITDPRW